jgi:hypothetical protein
LFICFESHEQFFSYLATVTTAGDRAANLDLCLALTFRQFEHIILFLPCKWISDGGHSMLCWKDQGHLEHVPFIS